VLLQTKRDVVLCSVSVIPLQHRSCSVCMSFVRLDYQISINIISRKWGPPKGLPPNQEARDGLDPALCTRVNRLAHRGGKKSQLFLKYEIENIKRGILRRFYVAQNRIIFNSYSLSLHCCMLGYGALRSLSLLALLALNKWTSSKLPLWRSQCQWTKKLGNR